MVAAQMDASFGKDADAVSTKAKAGRGDVVNPLELSPATPELSTYQTETVSEFYVRYWGERGRGRGRGREGERW